MSVWLCLPSARPAAEAEPILRLWRAQGYKVAVWRDTPLGAFHEADYFIVEPASEYPGYATACNKLMRCVMAMDASAEWLVAAGDDTEPDPDHTAEEIADNCYDYFWEKADRVGGPEPGLFGVMQPTGDRFAGGSIDRICGSPWIGREFARRMYGGTGPYFPEYRHMFVDEELQEVAKKLGVLWQRPDLVQLHNHFQRETRDVNSQAVYRPPPPHLVEANSPEHWKQFKALFLARQALGFPGHEPIP